MRFRPLIAAAAAAALVLTSCGGGPPSPEEQAAAEAKGVIDQIMDQAKAAMRDSAAKREARGNSGGDSGAGGDSVVGGEFTFGVGESDAPVVVTIDGVDFGYSNGSCWVDEDIVRVQAFNDNPLPVRDRVDIEWYPALGHLPYARQNVEMHVSNTAKAAPAPFELFASSNSITPDATWSVTVDGTSVDVIGTFTTDPRNPVTEPRAEEVTISVDCSERVFGGINPMGATSVDGETSVNVNSILGYLIDGHFDVEFQGATHSIDAITVCNTLGGDVSLQGTNNELEFYAYQGSTNSLRLDLGDYRLRDDRPVYQLPDGAEMTFDVNGDLVTWSGTLVGPNGEEESISISATCPAQ